MIPGGRMVERFVHRVGFIGVACSGLAALAIAQTAPTLPFGLLVAQQSRPSFSILGAGARSAGMGGAFTALADDAAAASFNPAGLALLLLPEVSIVGDGAERTDRHVGFTAIEAKALEKYGDTETRFRSSSINFGAFTLPFEVAKRNLCVQLSYHRLIDFTYDSDRTFDESVAGKVIERYRQRVAQSGEIHTLNLAVAYELTQRLSLGLSASKWSGNWTFATLDEGYEVPGSQRAWFAYGQNNRISGWNWNAGLLLRYRYLNFGAMYRSAFDADYRFASTFATNIPTQLTPEPAVTRPLRWPDSWTVGIAIKPTDTWHITTDYARYNWSKMEIRGLGSDGTLVLNFFDLKKSDATTTPDIDQWRFGTEYTMFAGSTLIALRAGYSREPQPQRLPAGGHQTTFEGYSGGIGFKFGRFSIDLAYQRLHGTSFVEAFVDPRTIATGALSSHAKGNIVTTEQRVFVALLYQFKGRERAKDVFRFLFVGPAEKKKDAT